MAGARGATGTQRAGSVARAAPGGAECGQGEWGVVTRSPGGHIMCEGGGQWSVVSE